MKGVGEDSHRGRVGAGVLGGGRRRTVLAAARAALAGRQRRCLADLGWVVGEGAVQGEGWVVGEGAVQGARGGRGGGDLYVLQ